MKKILLYFISLAFPIFAVMADDVVREVDVPHPTVAAMTNDDQTVQLLGLANQEKLHQEFQKFSVDSNDTDIPVSVSLNNPNDLNWEGVLGVNGMANGPDPVVLPFLQSYPIENLEVKFRVLKKKF